MRIDCNGKLGPGLYLVNKRKYVYRIMQSYRQLYKICKEVFSTIDTHYVCAQMRTLASAASYVRALPNPAQLFLSQFKCLTCAKLSSLLKDNKHVDRRR